MKKINFYSGNFYSGLALSLLVILLDQLSKWAILENLSEKTPYIEITSFFNLTLVWNHGISFGIARDFEARWFLVAATSALTIGLLIWLWRVQDRFLALALGGIIGGAIGNIIDRVRLGAVVDFLDFHAYNYHWPSFNVADSFICVGVLVLAWRNNHA